MRRRLQRCRERDRERDEVFFPSPPIDAAKIQFNRRVANKAQGVCIYIYIFLAAAAASRELYQA